MSTFFFRVTKHDFQTRVFQLEVFFVFSVNTGTSNRVRVKVRVRFRVRVRVTD